ncbi:hypothetical protein TNCV_1371381 [Trichonephila clavipes]|nr:hypothetical protein TNCV_1371381 [Trichonephila clavipes]
MEHRPGAQNVVADVLPRNPVDIVEGSQISCAALRALALNSREQINQEQREDPEAYISLFGKSGRWSLRCLQEHQIKDRRGGPIHLNKRAIEKQEWSLTEPERPSQILTEDTVQLRGDRSGLDESQQ